MAVLKHRSASRLFAACGLEQQLATDPVQLPFPPSLAALTAIVECRGHDIESLVDAAEAAAGFGQQGPVVRQAQPGDRAERVDAATHLVEHLFSRALRREAPRPQDLGPCAVVRESMLGGEGDHGGGQTIDVGHVTSKLAEHRRVRERDGVCEGVAAGLRHSNRVIRTRACAVGATLIPHHVRCPDPGKYAEVHPERGDRRSVLSGIVERFSQTEMPARRRRPPACERGPAQFEVRGHPEERVPALLRQREDVAAQRLRPVEVRAHDVDGDQPPCRLEHAGFIARTTHSSRALA